MRLRPLSPWGLLLALGPAFSAPPAAGQEPVVTAVEIRSDLGQEAGEELSSLVTLAPGEPLSEERIRRTLRNLQASGRVAEAAVYSRRDPGRPGGRLAVVALWGNLLVERVLLRGELGLPEHRLRSVLVQRSGLPLVEDQVLRGLYRLQDLYEANGYFAAEVRLEVGRAAGHRVTVTYQVASGPRWSFGSVGFDGEIAPFSPAQLLEPLETAPGGPYQARDLEEDPERLRVWLVRAGFRKARVLSPLEERNPQTRRVDVVFPLELGPLVEVEVRGAELEKLRKESLLAFLDDDGYDSALLIREQRRLRSYFQGRGHYRVEVELREEVEEDRIRVVAEIEPGPVYELEQIRFEGVEAFSGEQLEELMATHPRRRLRPGSGRLVDDVLEDDLENLRSFYALQGFWQARVGEPVIEVDETRLRLLIPVEEGPRRKIASLEWRLASPFEGATAEAIDLQAPTLEVGGAFHPRLLEEAVEDLRSRLRAEGYEWARVEAEQIAVDEQLVDVVLHVESGPRLRLDRLILRGNIDTRPSVVRRAVGLEPGDPVSRTRLLEVERSLSRLGIFSRVDVRLAPGELGGMRRDVVVQVEEGRARRLSYGLGYDSDDGVRGLLGFSHKNLWGRALGLQADARVSEQDERYRLLFNQPYLGRWDVPVTYSLFQFNEDRESFQQRSSGVRIEGRRDFGFARWGLAYDFRVIDLEEVEEPIERIDPQDREIQVSSLIPNLLLDRRDDPFEPTEGWSSSFQLQYAFPAFSTDAHFLKLFVQQTGYLDLGRPGVLAASVRAGAIEPLRGDLEEVGEGGEPLPEGAAENPVPIGERFFAGGRTSHRAYERDLLGITGITRIADIDPDSGEVDLLPVGGNGLFLVNLEYRFPILGPLGGTLFADAGNVWRDWRDVDLAEARYGVGLGLRYRSPIGPVRLEVGWNLDRELGEADAEVHLSFGNPF